jgi:hypothetical protein
VEDLSQTVYLVLGAGIYQGIYLMFPESHPQSRRIGGALAAGCVIAAIIYSRGFTIPSVSALSLAEYCVVALLVAVALTLVPFSRVVLERDASKLAIDLQDWSVLARAKLPRFATPAVLSTEAQRLDAEYKEKFGPRIVRLMKPLIAGDPIYTELRDTWLRAGSKITLDVASSAHLASKFFEKYGNELPIPVSKKWFAEAFVKSVTIYFAVALVLWFALFGLGHVIPAFEGEIIGVQVADTGDAVDLQGHRMNGTAIVLVAGIRNRGQPSALGKWNLTVSVEGTAYPSLAGKTPDVLKLHTNQSTVVYRGGGLDVRALDPIPQGKAIVGVLSFVVLGLSATVVDHPATKLTLTFADASDNQYEISRQLGLQSAPVIVPGVDMDVLPKPEPQPTNGKIN